MLTILVDSTPILTSRNSTCIWLNLIFNPLDRPLKLVVTSVIQWDLDLVKLTS